MRKNIAVSIAACLAFTLTSGTAFSSGYGVNLYDGYAAGMANAGHGVQESPMLSLVNPAAMILNKNHHVAMQGVGVFPIQNFKGTARNVAPAAGIPGIPYTNTARTGNAAVKAFIPSSGFVYRVNDALRLSVAGSAPYGLAFNYGNDSVTQFM